MVSTNTQQNRVFSYNGVLDTVKLVANSSETKTEIKDADAMGYVPSVEESETPEVPETPETPEVPETPNSKPQEQEEKGGCNGSVTTSLTLFGILLSFTGYILFEKLKLGRKEN